MISTPPQTTLTPPSPTTDSDQYFPSQNPAMRFPRVYLIVATSTSPAMGIGNNGSLPWPSLRNDMAFFARVTKRAQAGMVNAVIMGRKTWESIPNRFRPLESRWNIILTRDGQFNPSIEDKTGHNILVCDSIRSAFQEVERRSIYGEGEAQIDKIFVIGGSEVYRTTVEQATKLTVSLPRVVQTLVRRRDGGPFTCDTFFPIDLARGWKESTANELSDWVGEHVENGWKDAGDREGELDVSITGWEQEQP